MNVMDVAGRRIEGVALRMATVTQIRFLSIALGVGLALFVTVGGIAAFLIVLVLLVEVFG
jgi:hypothetical protein